VDGFVPGNRKQPRLEARPAAKRVETPVGGDQRVLRRVFRVGVRSKNRQRGAIDGSPVPIDQLAERGRVALPGSLDEVVIGHTDSRQRGGFAGWVDLAANFSPL